jgi:hypothetical protein
MLSSAALYRPLAVHVCIVRNQAKKEAAKVCDTLKYR